MVYVFAHWAEVICNKKCPCWKLFTVEVLSWHDSDHSTKCHAVNSPQPKIRPSQDNSQWHPSSPLSRTPSAKSAKQYTRITSRQYALHPEKSVAVFIPWHQKHQGVGRCMLYKSVSPLGPGWMSTTITSGYNWESMPWWKTALNSVHNFKARHPHCVFLN